MDEAIGDGSPSILGLIEGLRDLPPTVKVFASSKRDRRVRDALESFGNTTTVDLSGKEVAHRHRSDLTRYIEFRASRAVRTGALTENQLTPREVINAAEGNFQYARLWFDEIDAGFSPRAVDLPKGLPNLYRSYLDRLLPVRSGYGTAATWLEQYLPLLGVLAVAQEPMEVTVAADLTGWSEARVRACVDDLQQIVDLEVVAGVPVLRFFHLSMAEFLLVPLLDDRRPNPYFVDGAEFHLTIARSYLDRHTGATGSWLRCDGYGLRHIATHLALAKTSPGPLARTVLRDLLLASDLPAAQRARLGSSEQTARAFQIAVRLALTVGDFGMSEQFVHAMIRSGDRTLRAAAVGVLAEFHAREAATAQNVIIELLRQPDPDTGRVGLNAANAIGYRAGRLFRWIALSSGEDIRKRAAFTAYVRWSNGEHDTVSGFLRDLASSVSLWSPIKALRALRFLMDATIALYTNQCHDRQLAVMLNDLWKELLVRRLHLDRINGPVVQRALQRISTANSLSDRVLEAMLLSDLQDPQAFFDADASDRQAFLRGVALLERDGDLSTGALDVVHLLNSPIVVLRMLGALIVGTHARRDLPRLRRLDRAPFDQLSARGRLWRLIGLTTLVPTTDDWLAYTREMTEHLWEADRQVIATRDEGVLEAFNIFLLPHGLATGRQNLPQALGASVLASAVQDGNDTLATSVVSSLGLLALYHPHTSLAAMAQATAVRREAIDREVVSSLGIVAGVYPRSVDLFLIETGREDLAQAVRQIVDVGRTRRHFDRIGHFNNAVNQAVRHPVMRDGLLIPALLNVGHARLPGEYFARPSGLLNLLRVHDYELLRFAAEDDDESLAR
ncbi:hypothetical protein [Micromonospora tarensis]|uniref:Uncharacterized protein n=1 Tax=Micromonospora tarensis TaxID=2806100 RepID=A0ABS1YNG4_9ACTN|nr:hypothetical protein [Micromonospora tarensis]MBM0278972.1 hypothetical protein [Micromonospora tarensis]